MEKDLLSELAISDATVKAYVRLITDLEASPPEGMDLPCFISLKKRLRALKAQYLQPASVAAPVLQCTPVQEEKIQPAPHRKPVRLPRPPVASAANGHAKAEIKRLADMPIPVVEPGGASNGSSRQESVHLEESGEDSVNWVRAEGPEDLASPEGTVSEADDLVLDGKSLQVVGQSTAEGLEEGGADNSTVDNTLDGEEVGLSGASKASETETESTGAENGDQVLVSITVDADDQVEVQLTPGGTRKVDLLDASQAESGQSSAVPGQEGKAEPSEEVISREDDLGDEEAQSSRGHDSNVRGTKSSAQEAGKRRVSPGFSFAAALKGAAKTTQDGQRRFEKQAIKQKAEVSDQRAVPASDPVEGSKEPAPSAEAAEGGPLDETAAKKEDLRQRTMSRIRRRKDFVSWERVGGRRVNILEGLELHENVYSAKEQEELIEFVEELQERGRRGDLRQRTYTEPAKWMRGKGRITIQFGCCYNYAKDKFGNPPGILSFEVVDPIPPKLRKVIGRLVNLEVLPRSCTPDSCIINIYSEGDCIPPHIDHHDFLRPFCTLSLVSEAPIVLGTSLRVIADGEFEGSFRLPLPTGSVLVLNGNGADVAKHSVPAVPKRRISITFRKMDPSKAPRVPHSTKPLLDIPPGGDSLSRPSSSSGKRPQSAEEDAKNTKKLSAEALEFVPAQQKDEKVGRSWADMSEEEGVLGDDRASWRRPGSADGSKLFNNRPGSRGSSQEKGRWGGDGTRERDADSWRKNGSATNRQGHLEDKDRDRHHGPTHSKAEALKSAGGW